MDDASLVLFPSVLFLCVRSGEGRLVRLRGCSDGWMGNGDTMSEVYLSTRLDVRGRLTSVGSVSLVVESSNSS